MKYLKFGDTHLVNLENGHTFRLEVYSGTTFRILSNDRIVMTGSPEEMKEAFKKIEESVMPERIVGSINR